MKQPLLLFFSLLVVAASCKSTSQPTAETYQADDSHFRYAGRIDLGQPNAPVLIGSASSVSLAFIGDSVQIRLKKLNPPGEHNYVTLELNGDYLKRIRLEKDEFESFTISSSEGSSEKANLLTVYKATEAQNGNIVFGGAVAQQLQELPSPPKKTIEFIGNSITCGMGVDYEEIPCDSGVWYDQHNAFLAYGPRVARALDAQYLISCVSGIGIYRNWNSSPEEGSTMPEVYEKRYLTTADNQPWDFSTFEPDLVSIALGTNDFSDGDGIKARQPFDSARFVSQYIEFIELVYSKYPETQITLLASPMVSGEKGELFINCLEGIRDHFMQVRKDKKTIAIFNFSAITPHGCGYHPDKEDQRKMAELLLPFYKRVMDW